MIKDYFSNEFFLIALTFGSYFVGKLLRRRTGWVVMNPILVAIVVVIGFLEVTGVSYETYNAGGHMIEFWLRPAVVALGVPLYMQLEKIKKDLVPIMLSELRLCAAHMSKAHRLISAHGTQQADTHHHRCCERGYAAHRLRHLHGDRCGHRFRCQRQDNLF